MTMPQLDRPQAILAIALSALFLAMPIAPGLGADNGFPFDRIMQLDTAPMRGSKRLPALQFSENGTVEIDLWCASGTGTAVIAEDAVAIVPLTMQSGPCEPARMQRDEALLADITDVKKWRREGDLVVLISETKTLRYRLSTN
jgi:heat shock protein HslJ